MNQVSGSDLQPYENGGDALLPWGLRGDHKPGTILHYTGTLWTLYADLSRSTDFRRRLGSLPYVKLDMHCNWRMRALKSVRKSRESREFSSYR